MTIEFKNCKYQWQLQETLNSEFENLNFENENEFTEVADLLSGVAPEKKSLNKILEDKISILLDYLNSPEEQISADFVNSRLSMFGLQAPVTQAQCNEAYRALVQEIFKEKQAYLRDLSSAQRKEIIENKAKLKQAREKEQAALKEKAPPAPGSEASTYQIFLTRILGGEQKFLAVCDLLKVAPNMSEFRNSQGSLTGILTDEEGLRWQVDIFAQKDAHFSITVKNDDALQLNPAQPQTLIAAQTILSYEDLPSGIFPKKPLQLKNETMSDILYSKILKLVFVNYCMSFCTANDLNRESVEKEIHRILESDNELTRAELKERLLRCTQPPQRHPNIADLLGQLGHMINHGPGLDIGSDDELPEGLTFIPHGAIHHMFAALFGSNDDDEEVLEQQPEPQTRPRRNPERSSRQRRR